jgi:hypothetical protein
MTNEQINAAIAKACGICHSEKHGPLYKTDQGWVADCPNYCTDLNVMHEAEMRIPLLKRCEYLWYITLICHGCNEGKRTFVTTTASARQRAEAFLRTLGKWEATTEQSSAVGSIS